MNATVPQGDAITLAAPRKNNFAPRCFFTRPAKTAPPRRALQSGSPPSSSNDSNSIGNQVLAAFACHVINCITLPERSRAPCPLSEVTFTGDHLR